MTIASHLIPDPVHRLIVLVPDDSDYSNAARRIWELAHATGMCVLLLGLCRNTEQEPGLRRKLVTLSALVQDGRVATDVKTEVGMDWVDAVRNNYHTGDMVVCFAGQHAGLLHRPLSQILESNLKVPLYVLSSLDPQKPNFSRLSQVMGWSGSIGIIIGFGILQAKIVRLPEDWFQSVVFILSIIPEFWLIWIWNNLF